MRNALSYRDAMRALNQAAYAAASACKNEADKNKLKQICFDTDALVDALPSLIVVKAEGGAA
ncbi:hypothetical protein [Rhizobium bangladeshense]|uniref:hypothetical protein n=1 Tax=Rhizobium bangladeshense TaxID=1138189 RepID=UPI001C8370E3|nr:hypothetical protein [Rhizobium bangladeshense]MBX4889811.1 hypothetical protein [Rhizobium bangladeshense]